MPGDPRNSRFGDEEGRKEITVQEEDDGRETRLSMGSCNKKILFETRVKREVNHPSL